MTKEELKEIISEQTNLKNLPNKSLVNFMDKLSSEFDLTKKHIIELTYHLDKVEELYNNTLNEYQKRSK